MHIDFPVSHISKFLVTARALKYIYKKIICIFSEISHLDPLTYTSCNDFHGKALFPLLSHCLLCCSTLLHNCGEQSPFLQGTDTQSSGLRALIGSYSLYVQAVGTVAHPEAQGLTPCPQDLVSLSLSFKASSSGMTPYSGGLPTLLGSKGIP